MIIPAARWLASSCSVSSNRVRLSWAAAITTRRGNWSAIFSRVSLPPGSAASSLPDYAIKAIREALPAFDQQIKGFAMNDAVLTGVETRTSSPLRITRGNDYQSLNVKGLYPAGEGAGYAGGILSAGVDGIRVAEAVALDMLGKAARP